MTEMKRYTLESGVPETMMKLSGAPQELVDIYNRICKEEKWDELSACMTFYRNWLPIAFASYYDCVPDEHRYNFLLDLYAHGGDGVAAIRKEIRTASKYGSATLPPAFDGLETITVYRAGNEDIKKATYRLSWSSDPKKAEWFMTYSGLRKQSDMHLYKGEIKREKIIAYIDVREEKEIVQYRSVKNIQEMKFMTYQDIIKKYADNDDTTGKVG